MAEDKQGEINEPEEIAAEGSVGEQEQPTERQQDREQAIADEPVAESEQRAAEATQPAGPEAAAADEDAPAEPEAATDAQPTSPAGTGGAAEGGGEGERPPVKPPNPRIERGAAHPRGGDDALRH